MAEAGAPTTIGRELAILTRSAKARNQNRLRVSLLIAALIGLLLWKTQWPAIVPGLVILLAGQLGLAIFLAVRNSQLARPAELEEWFRGEARALRIASWIENFSRMAGFVLLAFGFWQSTRNLVLALALGVVYPAIVYWAMARVRARKEVRQLAAQRNRLEGLRAEPGEAIS